MNYHSNYMQIIQWNFTNHDDSTLQCKIAAHRDRDLMWQGIICGYQNAIIIPFIFDCLCHTTPLWMPSRSSTICIAQIVPFVAAVAECTAGGYQRRVPSNIPTFSKPRGWWFGGSSTATGGPQSKSFSRHNLTFLSPPTMLLQHFKQSEVVATRTCGECHPVSQGEGIWYTTHRSSRITRVRGPCWSFPSQDSNRRI